MSKLEPMPRLARVKMLIRDYRLYIISAQACRDEFQAEYYYECIELLKAEKDRLESE